MLETCGGLVTGAAAERLGGFGTVCCAYTGRSPPSQDAVRMFNFPWAMRDSLCCASLERLSAAADIDGTPDMQPHESAKVSQLSNGTSTMAAAPSDAAAPGQHEAAARLVLMADDAIKSPIAPGLVQQTDAAVAAVGLESSPGIADGLTRGPEAVCNDSRPVEPSVAGQHAEQACEELPKCGVATYVNGAAVLPALSAAAAQQSEPISSVGEQHGTDMTPAARIPRNMEAKRCITAVPPARFEHLQALVHPGFSGCLIAAPALQRLAAIQRLLPFLAPSAFFVVFSPFLQPLTEAMAALQASKAATNLQLQVWKEFCTLPADPQRLKLQ